MDALESSKEPVGYAKSFVSAVSPSEIYAYNKKA